MTTVDLDQSGIYAITSPSGKRYVGSAGNIQHRWRRHRRDLAQGKHHCGALQRAYLKYNGDLVYSVLIPCSKEELLKEEQWYMDSSAPGTLYNSAPTAGSPLGMRHSDETRAKVAAAQRGRQHSEETRAKMAAAKLGKAMKNNTSGYVGVVKASRGNKWTAQLCINGRYIHLGTHATAELANQARQNFDRILRYYDEAE